MTWGVRFRQSLGSIGGGLMMMAVGCGDGESNDQFSVDFASLSDSAKAGRESYVSQNCALCHGDIGQGTAKMGPSLFNLQENWTRDTMAEYLRDPEGYVQKHPEFESHAGDYTVPMKGYPGLKPNERLAISDYVLSLKQ